MMKECAHQPCGQPFEAKRSDARFCSASCRAAASRARRQGVEGVASAPRAAVIAADTELRGEVERLRGEVAALGRQVEAGRVEAERALAGVARELGLDRDGINERLGDLVDRVMNLEEVDLVERVERLEEAATRETGEEVEVEAPEPERFDERLGEIEQAVLKVMYGLQVLEERVEELDEEMARAVRVLVGVH